MADFQGKSGKDGLTGESGLKVSTKPNIKKPTGHHTGQFLVIKPSCSSNSIIKVKGKGI